MTLADLGDPFEALERLKADKVQELAKLDKSKRWSSGYCPKCGGVWSVAGECDDCGFIDEQVRGF